MAEKFQDQGGFAAMDPSPLKRWLASRFVSRRCSDAQVQKRRAKAERERVSSGSGHVVEYFHSVEDGYSRLAESILAAQDNSDFIESAAHVGDALWNADQARLQSLATGLGAVTMHS